MYALTLIQILGCLFWKNQLGRGNFKCFQEILSWSIEEEKKKLCAINTKHWNNVRG